MYLTNLKSAYMIQLKNPTIIFYSVSFSFLIKMQFLFTENGSEYKVEMMVR